MHYSTTAATGALAVARIPRASSAHVTPAVRKKYPGSALFSHTESGQMVLIRSNFPRLTDSPLFYEHLEDFVAEKTAEPGRVYKFVGTYMVFKNGKPSFSGSISEIDC